MLIIKPTAQFVMHIFQITKLIKILIMNLAILALIIPFPDKVIILCIFKIKIRADGHPPIETLTINLIKVTGMVMELFLREAWSVIIMQKVLLIS
jgi:hypothetical protein